MGSIAYKTRLWDYVFARWSKMGLNSRHLQMPVGNFASSTFSKMRLMKTKSYHDQVLMVVAYPNSPRVLQMVSSRILSENRRRSRSYLPAQKRRRETSYSTRSSMGQGIASDIFPRFTPNPTGKCPSSKSNVGGRICSSRTSRHQGKGNLFREWWIVRQRSLFRSPLLMFSPELS